MLELNGQNVYIGGFHDHWTRSQTDNPALLMAAMNYYHYDFMCLMCGGEGDRWLCEVVPRYLPRVRLFAGEEKFFGWGHVVTVGCTAPHIQSDDSDYEAVLRSLKSQSALTALAHPSYPDSKELLLASGEVDRLVDEGAVDAVEMCQTPGDDAWLERRVRAGKPVPIVAGWDAHLVLPLAEPRDVFYNAATRPAGHIDTCGLNRTIVLAPTLTQEAIMEAVKSQQSVVQNLKTGRLQGNPEVVAFLKRHGFHEAVGCLDERYQACSLQTDRSAVAGEPLVLKFDTPGTVRLGEVTLDEPVVRETDDEGVLVIDRVPDLLPRDVTHLPLVKVDADGYERAWAISVKHPVQLDVLPTFAAGQGGGAGRPGVQVVPREPFAGTYELSFGDEPHRRLKGSDQSLVQPAPEGVASVKPVPWSMTATSSRGVVRDFQGFVQYWSVPRFNGDWSQVVGVRIDEACFDAVHAFGHGRDWQGPETFSAEMKMAWTPEALCFEAHVVAAQHYQPYVDDWVYNADSIQLGIDPLLRRSEDQSCMYAFNLALTPKGEQLYRVWSPANDLVAGFTQPPEGRLIPGDHLAVEPWERGMVYRLQLPWSELSPVSEPGVGTRLGLYAIFANNEGQGNVDVLHWPVPIRGMWLVPRRWGVIELV